MSKIPGGAWIAAAALVISTPALGQTACDKIESDWDSLERNLAQNEADMAKEDSAVRASVLATQNQTIINKAEALASAAQRLKCTKVYVIPESDRYLARARRCTNMRRFLRITDSINNTRESEGYIEQCDQSKWEPDQPD